MAIIEHPIPYKDRKKYGNVQCYLRCGKWNLRTKPLSIPNPRTPAQQTNRMRTGKLGNLIPQVLGYIKEAYAGSVKGLSPYHHLVSINQKKCYITDTLSIDPSLFVLCDNDGSFVDNVVLTSTVADTITGTFDGNVQTADEGEDPVRAYGFDVDANKIWHFDQSDIRKTGTITLTQPDMSGLQIAVYFECLDRVNLLNDKPKHVIKYVGTINVI
jgi:hypothetical protein